MFNNSDYQKLAEFSSYFLSDTNQQPACNFATFAIYMEDTPLQVSKYEWIGTYVYNKREAIGRELQRH